MSRDVHTPTIEVDPELGEVGFGAGDAVPLPLPDDVGDRTLVACSNPHAANASAAVKATLSERDLDMVTNLYRDARNCALDLTSFRIYPYLSVARGSRPDPLQNVGQP
jgi:hypothetical protein